MIGHHHLLLLLLLQQMAAQYEQLTRTHAKACNTDVNKQTPFCA